MFKFLNPPVKQLGKEIKSQDVVFFKGDINNILATISKKNGTIKISAKRQVSASLFKVFDYTSEVSVVSFSEGKPQYSMKLNKAESSYLSEIVFSQYEKTRREIARKKDMKENAEREAEDFIARENIIHLLK